MTEALQAPACYPGCSGTRNLHDNLSDLRAQVAANQRGSQLVGELMDTYGLDVVQAYMGYIQVCVCVFLSSKKETQHCLNNLIIKCVCVCRGMQNWQSETC